MGHLLMPLSQLQGGTRSTGRSACDLALSRCCQRFLGCPSLSSTSTQPDVLAPACDSTPGAGQPTPSRPQTLASTRPQWTVVAPVRATGTGHPGISRLLSAGNTLGIAFCLQGTIGTASPGAAALPGHFGACPGIQGGGGAGCTHLSPSQLPCPWSLVCTPRCSPQGVVLASSLSVTWSSRRTLDLLKRISGGICDSRPVRTPEHSRMSPPPPSPALGSLNTGLGGLPSKWHPLPGFQVT